MWCSSRITVVAISALLFANEAWASQFRRQDGPSTENATGDTPVDLEPILPPDGNPKDFDILMPDPKVHLFYGGTTSNGAASRKRADQINGAFASLDLTLLYPTVPLDHSAFIGDISCSADVLTADFLTQDSFDFAKENWPKNSKVVLITSAHGCGQDLQNAMFVASSISFSDSDRTVTARGEEVEVKKTIDTMDLKWGVAPNNIVQRRSLDRRSWWDDIVDWFDDITTWTGTSSHAIPFGIYPEMGGLFRVADDAPWPNSVLLYEWNYEGGTKTDPASDPNKLDPDASGAPERRHARDLIVREEGGEPADGLEAGLSLYCVDCGIEGQIDLFGQATYSITGGFSQCTIDITTNLYAGLFLGLEMHANYHQEWKNELLKYYLQPYNIPLILTFGPYFRLGLEAELTIDAEAKILLGASAKFEDAQIHIDLLNWDQNYQYNWDPTIHKRAEAEAKLDVTAEFRMPVGVGLDIDVLAGLLHIGAEFTDVPKVTGEVKLALEWDGGDGDPNPTPRSIEGRDEAEDKREDGPADCPGLYYSLKFENDLVLSCTKFEDYIFDQAHYELTLAEDCIPINLNQHVCGDGDVTGDEVCDTKDDENCVEGCGTCKDYYHAVDGVCVEDDAVCGDGRVSGDEVCDFKDDDQCKTDCTACRSGYHNVDGVCTEDDAVCGDGNVTGAEVCDRDGDDHCMSDCSGCEDGYQAIRGVCLLKPAVCGDGKVTGLEVCDTKHDSHCNACTACATGYYAVNGKCTKNAPVCGDGAVTGWEACDKQNDANCNSRCNGCKKGYRPVRGVCTKDADLCYPRSIPNPNHSSSSTCWKSARGVKTTGQRLGQPISVPSLNMCSHRCLKNSACHSFSYTTANQQCVLFKKRLSQLGGYQSGPAGTKVFSDRDCYKMTTCPAD